MGKNTKCKRVMALALALAMVAVLPAGAYASDGKKHFKQGMKYQQNKQWDKAAEQYALAVAESPSNVEYTLHYQRALVNAALMLVERGDMLAEQKDYNAAYQAYRRAYAFDPTNELALIKMRRMLEVQGLPTKGVPRGGDPSGPRLKPDRETGDTTVKASVSTEPAAAGAPSAQAPTPTRIPAYRAKQRILYRPGTTLQAAIENLAGSMKLNVMFDSQVLNLLKASNQNFSVNLDDVSPAKALEMILQSNNLMYSQFDKRTIIVASDNPQTRQRYEPAAVRTFYIKNADITDVRTVLQGALPSSKNAVVSKQLNALVVRDTPANLELIESIINSLDKSKAEVLIDVNLYEVSQDDLLKLGNQVFSAGEQDKDQFGLGFLGGLGQESNILSKGPRTLKAPFAFALGLPTTAVSFFQSKGKAKLLAATQIHVLDNENHKVNIGQRVPIQTASLPSGFIQQTGRQPRSQDQQLDQFFSGSFGIPQIQYENVGLNIDMTPSVYEDDVQIKMSIETSSVDLSTGKRTPTFNQRKMSSVARIKDGQTTMIAGVSQNEQARQVKGIPFVGLIPILGRFFSTPDTTDHQSDVVITVTPHILRRADIREEDHLARDSGTGSNSNRQISIEQILYLADQQEAQQAPVAANNLQPEKLLSTSALSPPQNNPQPAPGIVNAVAPPGVVVTAPGSTSTRVDPTPAVQRKRVSAPGVQKKGVDEDDDDDEEDTASPQGQITVAVRGPTVVSKGQQYIAAIIVNGNAQISSASIALTYDPTIFDVKGVRNSGLMNAGAGNVEPQFTAQAGMLNVQLDRPPGTGGVLARGQLLYIIFEAKGQGQTALALAEHSAFRGPNGQAVLARFEPAQIEVK